MNQPSEKQIRDEATRFAAVLGGAIHLNGRNLAESVDAKYPGMSDAEFKEVRTLCGAIAEEMHGAALKKMWATN